MEFKTVLKANIKRHRGAFVGILILNIILSMALVTVISVWANSNSYISGEMSRMGYGDITAWVSGTEDISELKQQTEQLAEVEKAVEQSLIFSDYVINDIESDSEGQLILYQPELYPYKIFSDDFKAYSQEPANILPGEIYISPSIKSSFDVEIGDEISFLIARQGGEKIFTVKGYFEDPFMGSSMIGMKGFLINEQDSTQIRQMIKSTNINALARQGYMLHIFQQQGKELSASELNRTLNEQTALPEYAEFVHSSAAILGFMVVLQNIFTGLLLAFVAILVAVSLVALAHSINSAIEQDSTNIGILKTMGFTGKKLRKILLVQYFLAILSGMALGVILANFIIVFVGQALVTTTGLLVPAGIPMLLCAVAIVLVLVILFACICINTIKISKISPIKAIYKSEETKRESKAPAIKKKALVFWIALRQIISGKKRYIGCCVIAILLVFFASMIGRMNSWLGPNGEGMMDAFNPAALDIAVQPMGDIELEELERDIAKYSTVTDKYLLAMPSVSVNGVDYTANVITEPERFNILRGSTSVGSSEVVLTESVAADLGVDIGDIVTIGADVGSGEYSVSGIYQCANDMGANIGLSSAAYSKIGSDDPYMWCAHYFIQDTSQKSNIIDNLKQSYAEDIYIHENSWPGLFSILSAMQMLMLAMYVIVAIFITIVVYLTGSKILFMEQKDIAIYKLMGFRASFLRMAFALRFGIVSAIGAALGVGLSAVFTDSLISSLLKLCGISNFVSSPSPESMALPAIVVFVLFTVFAYISSVKIKRARLSILTAE